jgi:hypothetical protein
MSTFSASEYVDTKQDFYFVKEDSARVYRGLKDMLLEEFNMDRIEEDVMQFSTKKPKDRIRLHAFKEKSQYTVVHYSLSWKAEKTKKIYRMEHGDDYQWARVKTSALVETRYPGGSLEPYEPRPISASFPGKTTGETLQESEGHTTFQKSSIYEILVELWYELFYESTVEEYQEQALENMVRIQDRMRQKFGAQKSVHRTTDEYNPPWNS